MLSDVLTDIPDMLLFAGSSGGRSEGGIDLPDNLWLDVDGNPILDVNGNPIEVF